MSATKQSRVQMALVSLTDPVQKMSAEVVTLMPDGEQRRMTGVVVNAELLRQEGYDEEVIIPVMRAMELAFMFNAREGWLAKPKQSKPSTFSTPFSQCDVAWLTNGPFQMLQQL